VSVRDDVLDLLGRYCECMDAADWDGLGSLFAHGVMADADGRPFAVGAVEVANFFRAGIHLYDGSPRTKHIVANTVVDESAPGVSARSSFVVYQSVYDSPLQTIAAGRYVDRFDRGPALRFAERRFVLEFTGDLGRHLIAAP
jgi:3-phenylpropionate/cinnamic acid dioxygenase small subunit